MLFTSDGLRATRRAFTLTELLAVIGIIGVLIALVAPMAVRVREQAKSTACAANERQIYLATRAYAGDYNDALFYAPMYGEGVMNAPYAFAVPSLGIISYTQGAIWPYFSASPTARRAVMTCPSDNEECPNNHPGTQRNFSYSFNAGLTWYNGHYDLTNPPLARQLNFQSIPSPSHKILIWEEVGPNDGACWCLGGERDDYPTQRHAIYGKAVSDNGVNANIHGSGFGNQCFADGHVELLQPQVIWSVVYYCDLRKEQ